jgi:hypothetical protein
MMVARAFKQFVKQGLLTMIGPTELFGLQLKLRGQIEPELTVFPRLVQRGTVAIDVGANVGLYS